MAKLSASERKLLKSVDRGEWRRVPNFEQEKARYQKMAALQSKKAARVNIRLSFGDLTGLRQRAMDEGLPYQTLISSLIHKYLSGRLVEKAAR